MGTLPPLHFHAPPPWQRACLVAWLGEWDLDQRLRAADEAPLLPNPDAGQEPDGTRVEHFDPEPKCGDIRLLSPGLVPGADRPIYVAVIAHGQDELLLLAPFSRFSTPATPGEWAMGRAEPGLRVLSLWNARTVSRSLLAKSWLVDELTQEERRAAWAVFEHVTVGEPLPDSVSERVGPPVSHPGDSRHLYQEEEAAMLDDLAEAEELEGWALEPLLIPYTEAWDRTEANRAVAARADSGSAGDWHARYEAPDHGVFLTLRGAEGVHAFLVLDAAGESSPVLDGAVILTPEHTEVGRIERGVGFVPRAELPGAFRLEFSGVFVQLVLLA